MRTIHVIAKSMRHSIANAQCVHGTPVRDASPIINVIVFELIQSKHFVNVTHEIYVDCWQMIYWLTTVAAYDYMMLDTKIGVPYEHF